MKIHIESSKFIKPFYEGTSSPRPPTTQTPLSVFDEVTYVANFAYIYAYKPPTPANALLELGLRKVLAIYRQWAGRLIVSDKGIHSIFLINEGVRLIEASADSTLDEILPLYPSKVFILDLHANINEIDKLLQVQLTRFTCGSLVVGVTVHHQVADGQATINFLVAWGQACRGLTLNPLPSHDRTIFSPRDPPCTEFQHRKVEFMSKKQDYPTAVDTVIMHKVHFTLDFLSRLKAKASSANIPTSNAKNLYTTFESLVAHLWRSTTMARQRGSHETTHVRISINGRNRLNPRVPDEYFGNLVLWAFPKAIVKDLLNEPLSFAAKLIHEAVTKIDNRYFKSFIDFASNEAKEGLISTADNNKNVLSPNIDVDSWLRFPFYDVDFGGGSPFIFVPSEVPVEGLIFHAPSFLMDGSIDAFVSLYQENYAAFKRICYSLD